MNKSIIILLGMFFFSFISAISISPTNIDLGNVYPNQIIPYNISILSNENTTIYFTSSNSNITINPNNVNITEDTNITLNFLVAGDIQSGEMNFKIITCKDDYCTEPVSSSSESKNYESSGGGNAQYENKIKIVIPDNSSNQTSNSGNENTNNSNPVNSNNNNPEKKSENPLFQIIYIISLIVMGIIEIYFIFRKVKGGQNE